MQVWGIRHTGRNRWELPSIPVCPLATGTIPSLALDSGLLQHMDQANRALGRIDDYESTSRQTTMKVGNRQAV
jgi:hypothetical protein